MTINRETYKRANQVYNRYYEEFHSCKKAWLKGTIFGLLIGAALSFLISGFQFDETFFILTIFQGMAGILVLTAVFGMKYTSDFGLSCIPRAITKIGDAGYEFFEGTYVLLWVYYLIMVGLIGGKVLALCVFSFLFPVQTLYYWIRYKMEAKRVSNMLKNGEITME